MVDILLIDPSDQAIATIDWTDVLASGITLSGNVSHTLPSPLVKLSENTDTVSGLSQVRISGAVHGRVYMVEGQASLSNGEVINRQFPVRCFNG